MFWVGKNGKTLQGRSGYAKQRYFLFWPKNAFDNLEKTVATQKDELIEFRTELKFLSLEEGFRIH